MSQNRSTAVMQRRHKIEPPRPDDWKDSLDFYPTPLWGTRALCEWLTNNPRCELRTCWEPACGEGHMVRALRESFGQVAASDVFDYGFPNAIQHDFLLLPQATDADWIITNPPFSLAGEFASKALDIADCGVALLVRIAFLESADRYRTLFRFQPPSDILQFVERLPMQKGVVNREGSSATAYCWLVWRKPIVGGTRFHWLAPCRKRLELDSDYPIARAAE